MFPARVFSREKGFTLIEALVVMVIIALVAAVTIPSFVRLARRQKVVAAAHEIQQTLLAARMRAIRANQPASLVIVPASGSASHELDLVSPDPFPLPTPTPVSKTFLPANSISFVTLPLNNKVTFGGDGRVLSLPAPTPAVITVQGPVGAAVMNQVTIQANSSGRVQVVTPTVWQ